jgi:hypothetical protein
MKLYICNNFPHHLARAGHAPNEADQLGAAWAGAAGWLAGALGLEIESGGDPARQTTTVLSTSSDKPAELLIWQAAHDLVAREGAAWRWRENTLTRLAAPRSPADPLPCAQVPAPLLRRVDV